MNPARGVPKMESIKPECLSEPGRVPVCIMNVTNQDHVLSEGTIVGHREPAVWATTINDQMPQP